MRVIPFLAALLITINTFGQKHTPLPHGMIFGIKPGTTAMMPAYRLEAFMGKEIRTSVTIRGMVLKVTKLKGGWFDVDAGKGKVIKAHFKNYAITLPADIKGRIVIMEGVAEKQFIADDMQHLAGDTVIGKKQHHVNANPKQRLTFEMKGLMIDK